MVRNRGHQMEVKIENWCVELDGDMGGYSVHTRWVGVGMYLLIDTYLFPVCMMRYLFRSSQ